VIANELTFDFTPELPTGEAQPELAFVERAAELGNSTLSLLAQHGSPATMNLVFEPDETVRDPYRWAFWVPPGITPILTAERQEDGSFTVRAFLPGVGDSALPSMNQATYSMILPQTGYHGVQTKITLLERTFYMLEGGRRSLPHPNQLEVATALNSVCRAVSALVVGKPRLNGTYSFSTATK
jgi:hypothetical protein